MRQKKQNELCSFSLASHLAECFQNGMIVKICDASSMSKVMSSTSTPTIANAPTASQGNVGRSKPHAEKGISKGSSSCQLNAKSAAMRPGTPGTDMAGPNPRFRSPFNLRSCLQMPEVAADGGHCEAEAEDRLRGDAIRPGLLFLTFPL